MNSWIGRLAAGLITIAAMGWGATPVAARQGQASCLGLVNKIRLEHGGEISPSIVGDPLKYWHETDNTGAYDYIDGSRIKSFEQLARRLKSTDKPLHVIIGAQFAGWDFTDLAADAQGLCFYRSDLSGSQWDGMDVSRSGFIESSLAGARMRRANLDGVLFDNVSLQDANMQFASLGAGALTGAWSFSLADIVGDRNAESGLNNWDLSNANLTGFKFDCGIEVHNGCPLDRRIILNGADLASAEFQNFPGWGEFRLSGARLNRTILTPDQLIYFDDAVFAGPLVLAGKLGISSTIAAEQARILIDQFNAADALEEAASFDCNLAVGPVEQMICSEEGGQRGLKREDRLMARAYHSARKRVPDLAMAQVAWLAQRNACRDYDCIEAQYVGRTETLLGLSGVPDWIAKGESVLFAGGQPNVLPEYQSSDLWLWLQPVLAEASDQQIVVTHGQDGTWSIKGRSVGANAHVCYIDASGLLFDRRDGWFVFHPADGTAVTPVFRIVGQELQVLGHGHPDREIFPDSDFVSCGARASFDWSRHVALSEEEVDLFEQRLGLP